MCLWTDILQWKKNQKDLDDFCKGKIIYKAIEVSCLINLHFPSNLNFSFRGMLLNAECSASLFNQVALQISRYFFLTRVKPYLVFLLSWISSITTFLSLSLHSEIAGRFRAHDLNFWLISSKKAIAFSIITTALNCWIIIRPSNRILIEINEDF